MVDTHALNRNSMLNSENNFERIMQDWYLHHLYLNNIILE